MNAASICLVTPQLTTLLVPGILANYPYSPSSSPTSRQPLTKFSPPPPHPPVSLHQPPPPQARHPETPPPTPKPLHQPLPTSPARTNTQHSLSDFNPCGGQETVAQVTGVQRLEGGKEGRRGWREGDEEGLEERKRGREVKKGEIEESRKGGSDMKEGMQTKGR